MGFQSSAITLPLGVLLLFSGFSVNCVQALSLLLLPFSRSVYRIVNAWLVNLLWSELVWLLDSWAHVKVLLYTDEETMKHMGTEHALVICNHRGDIDWLVGWHAAQVIGWSMYFAEYVFLSRSWAKDEKTLRAGYMNLKSFPRPFWLALFVEGTRFTKEKLLAAQEYAVSVGKPIPKNVLVPRTKGFVSAVQSLRSFTPALYDMTIAVSQELPAPTMARVLQGQPSVIHLFVERVSMEDLPKTDEGLADWCKAAFIRKDELLEQHKKENTFGEHLYKPIPIPRFPLFVVCVASLLTLTTFIWLLMSWVKTWEGVAWVFGSLVAVMGLLEILIQQSQAERSNPASLLAKVQANPPLIEKKKGK